MILAQLEPLMAQRNASKIQAVQMRRAMVLQEAGAAVQWVWFPEDALICIASENMNGESVSGSMMGCNGAYGAFEACGSRVSFTRAFVQIAGSGYRIRADHYRELFEQSPALRTAIHKHIESLLVEARHLLACTALHPVESRFCRALLDAAERSHAGSVLSLTQETLAQILGVQRTTIAATASILQKDGLIRTVRGNIELIDKNAIETAACACRQTIAYATNEIYSSTEKVCKA